ncbi:aldehyde dehydrogenase family protein [Streptomyces sp. TRM43335]|uniref:Aldehyde dehydrogenase family protein n=1 Tax=Streptomyces taklimakanensis TaxID=2569853 RepID=A0A6G2BCU5_9ACTN|nr:aldehyde dehydrogenase family protein [Streptomyces taklimakanensis]MTE20101.1 aldehyde dehydrogenase family protein [Streptomyces taklimakanensis]
MAEEAVTSSLFIGGAWTSASDGATREIINPYDQSVVRTVAEGGRTDAQAAVSAAREAFDGGEWPSWRARQRSELLHRVAEFLQRDRAEIARLETLDTGKTLTESGIDVDDVTEVFRYYANLAEADSGRLVDAGDPRVRSRVVYEPVGVCAMIAPWNYPLLQVSWKVAPALAAGNTMVIKPSEITPLTTIKMVELLQEAGAPAGVVNLVLGSGGTVGAALVESPQVDLVSFTGGLETGRTIMRSAADTVKRIALELGGKNPNIVFADAEFEAAIDYALTAVFFHAGQVCSAGTRLVVEDSLHDRFVDALVERAERIRLGNGMDEHTESGPLVSAEHRDKVESYVELGLREGARLVAGGKRPDDPELGDGFFYRPTVFVDCTRDMRIVQEETFGPILTVERFTEEEEAIELGNHTDYGLAGAVWTRDAGRAERVARRLRHGTVWINDFGPYLPQAEWGGFKRSGIGRELGYDGLAEYRQAKHIYENTAPEPQRWFAR